MKWTLGFPEKQLQAGNQSISSGDLMNSNGFFFCIKHRHACVCRNE